LISAPSPRTWREHGVKPFKEETFKFSTDPELEAKVIDVVGLYMAPPENAVVLCIDEKSQIQALDRTQPGAAAADRLRRQAHPRPPTARDHDLVRRPGHRHRQANRTMQTGAHAQGVLVLP
jgi:hypothetical protein